MDNNNSNFQGHPFYVALALFNEAAQTPFNIAAAFWRPWFADAGKKKVQGTQGAEAPPVQVSLPKTENQLAAIAQQLAAVPEEVSRRTKRKQTPKPRTKKVAVEKKSKPPTKRTLKEELELEREERAQKTERLRKLRQAKDAADRRKRSPSNGHGGARNVIKQ